MGRLIGAIALAAGMAASVISCGGGSERPSAGSPTAPTTATPNVASVKVSGPESLAKPGESTQFNASAVMSNGASQVVTGSASWQSSNSEVATVDSSGIVTGVATGESDIRASYQNVVGSAHITVRAPAAPAPTPSATFTISGVTRVEGGSTLSGVAIVVRDAPFSTTSDGNGRYSISAVPSGQYTLRATRSGYDRKDVAVTVSANITKDISLRQTGPAPSPAPSPTPAPAPAPAPAPPSPTPGSNTCAKPASAPASSTAQCKDGTFSSSQNRSGTCSSHGGVSCFFCPGRLCAGFAATPSDTTATIEQVIAIIDARAAHWPEAAANGQ